MDGLDITCLRAEFSAEVGVPSGRPRESSDVALLLLSVTSTWSQPQAVKKSTDSTFHVSTVGLMKPRAGAQSAAPTSPRRGLGVCCNISFHYALLNETFSGVSSLLLGQWRGSQHVPPSHLLCICAHHHCCVSVRTPIAVTDVGVTVSFPV